MVRTSHGLIRKTPASMRRARADRGRIGRSLVAGVACGALLFGFYGAAQAAPLGVKGSAGPDYSLIPGQPVTVGATNLPVSFAITNTSDGAQSTGNVTVSNIIYTPTCRSVSNPGTCTGGDLDPAVFVAHGPITTEGACATNTMSLTALGNGAGEYSITSPTAIVLGDAGTPAATCTIRFQIDVIKLPLPPTGGPVPPPTTTFGLGRASLLHVGGLTGSGTGTTEITVVEPTPTPTNTPTNTPTPTETPTLTPTLTPTNTPTPTSTPTETPTRTPTLSPTPTSPPVPVVPSPTSPAGLLMVGGLAVAIVWMLRRGLATRSS